MPDDLAQVSLEIARGLGLSRSEFIRQAVEHEIAHARGVSERRAIALALHAMTTDAAAAARGNDLDEGLIEALPAERDGWWKG